VTPEVAPFRCSYELDARLDKELVQLNQSLYRRLQQALEGGYKVRLTSEGLPDAVQFYLLYVAALIYGAADAVLTLSLHNLGREARILERQVFEYWLRASYYAEHPEEARVAFHSTPFQEKALLDELRYSKDSDRYREVLDTCNEIALKVPEAARYREPSVRSIIDPKNNEELSQFYALHYRASSQMAHASFNGVVGVWGMEGLSFDSRQGNPNYSIETTTSYLLVFMILINDKLELNLSAELESFKETFAQIQRRLRVLAENSGSI